MLLIKSIYYFSNKLMNRKNLYNLIPFTSPTLLSAYFVFKEYVNNMHQLIFLEILRSLVFVFLVTLFLNIVVIVIFRELHSSRIIASLVILCFYNFSFFSYIISRGIKLINPSSTYSPTALLTGYTLTTILLIIVILVSMNLRAHPRLRRYLSLMFDYLTIYLVILVLYAFVNKAYLYSNTEIFRYYWQERIENKLDQKRNSGE